MSVSAILYGMVSRHRHCIAMAPGSHAAVVQAVHNLGEHFSKTRNHLNKPVMEKPPAGDKQPL
jgi:hypothetical protein